MTALKADATGKITGKFTIPANVPTGRKQVTVLGDQGSMGSTVFVSDGEDVIDYERLYTTEYVFSYDPVAQTFTLPAASHVSAVDVYFTAIPTTQARVQLRETAYGVPTQAVLAEAILPASLMGARGYNRFVFPTPVNLLPNVEYAVVVLANDAVAAVGVAELGKYDSSAARWVTSQPYSVGVMLTSSNASSWTPQQTLDLTFRLVANNYFETSRMIDLGNVAVVGATELKVGGQIDSPVPGAGGHFVVTLPDGTAYSAAPGQIISLTSAITGNVNVKASLTAIASHSGVLQPGNFLAAGTLATTGTYITPAQAADSSGTNIHLMFDAIIPSGATVTAAYSGIDGGDTWVGLVQDIVPVPLGDNVYEYSFRANAVTEAMLKFMLTLNGTPAARPRVRNLRILLT